MPHFFDNGGCCDVGSVGVEPLHAVEVQAAVGLYKADGETAHGWLGEKAALHRDEDVGTVAAVGKQREGGHDIVDGIVRVGALQVEGLEEFFEFIDPQAGLDKAGEF